MGSTPTTGTIIAWNVSVSTDSDLLAADVDIRNPTAAIVAFGITE